MFRPIKLIEWSEGVRTRSPVTSSPLFRSCLNASQRMFETLTDKLQRAFKNLRGQGKLTEEHLDPGPRRNPRIAARRRRQSRRRRRIHRARPRESPRLGSPSPAFARSASRQNRSRRARRPPRPRSQAAIRLAPAFGLARSCGLQGSGKTTSTGKLGKWLAEHGHRPIVVSTDVYRPAAREQLAQVAKATGTPLWPGAGTDKPLEIVRGATREAKLVRLRRDPRRHRRPPAHRRRIDERTLRCSSASSIPQKSSSSPTP